MYRTTASSRPFRRSNGNPRYHQRPANGHTRNRFSTQSRGKRSQKLDHRLFINKTLAGETLQAPTQTVKHTFPDFDVIDSLKTNIANKNYQSPTPIQDQAIPVILQGRDVIGIANTGTGKTAAFLIPLIHKVALKRNEKVLIVVPTRELAIQIDDELYSFAKNMGIYAVLTIGGASMGRQINELRRSHNFVIGTPGRLKDLIKQHVLNLSDFRTVVLDEVDRMVDIGFIRDVQYLISLMPSQRQSLFFSATVAGKVEQILHQFVQNPVKISVQTPVTAHTIEQDVVYVQHKEQKVELLHDLLVKDGFDKVLVFGRTKWGVEKLSQTLLQRGFKTAAIHGNKSQGQRQRALQDFKNNTIRILLATDVASRGIDVDNISHVINYDAPQSYDDYIHRIGRTGRANKKGMAITFVE